ncbi:hypothetical protein IWX90DRAFT_228181 [Phyllosticta citrichinensis]|uniref:Transmembrane protein n=1 Tax=Phyllosticta citrichinensis TaxID=1130410 RepID=A0ABR1XUD3_9PEZI
MTSATSTCFTPARRVSLLSSGIRRQSAPCVKRPTKATMPGASSTAQNKSFPGRGCWTGIHGSNTPADVMSRIEFRCHHLHRIASVLHVEKVRIGAIARWRAVRKLERFRRPVPTTRTASSPLLPFFALFLPLCILAVACMWCVDISSSLPLSVIIFPLSQLTCRASSVAQPPSMTHPCLEEGGKKAKPDGHVDIVSLSLL